MKIRVTQTFRDREFDLKERKAGTVYEVTAERAAVLIGKGFAEAVAAAASAEELKGFVPKSRFDEVNEEKKNLQTAKKKAEDDLEELKKSAGDNADLQKQISDLQNAAKQKDTEYAEQIKTMKLANAIRIGITDAQDASYGQLSAGGPRY